VVELFHMHRDRQPFNRIRFLWNLDRLPQMLSDEHGKEFYEG
jgi:hypothetical protein